MADVLRCGECKFWAKAERFSYGTCERLPDNWHPDAGESPAYIRLTGWGCEGLLITRPTFGCVLAEPREREE